MDTSPTTITRLLLRMKNGDESAAIELLPLVYSELRGIAAAAMSSERRDHTLQPTALVHEAWVRLKTSEVAWDDRHHFLRVAARAMRHILVDHARARLADKRRPPPERHEPEDVIRLEAGPGTLDIMALDEALARLAESNERLARVVELRFFGGLTAEETADALGITTHQVHYAWELAKAWLHRELREE